MSDVTREFDADGNLMSETPCEPVAQSTPDPSLAADTADDLAARINKANVDPALKAVLVDLVAALAPETP